MQPRFSKIIIPGMCARMGKQYLHVHLFYLSIHLSVCPFLSVGKILKIVSCRLAKAFTDFIPNTIYQHGMILYMHVKVVILPLFSAFSLEQSRIGGGNGVGKSYQVAKVQ